MQAKKSIQDNSSHIFVSYCVVVWVVILFIQQAQKQRRCCLLSLRCNCQTKLNCQLTAHKMCLGSVFSLFQISLKFPEYGGRKQSHH